MKRLYSALALVLLGIRPGLAAPVYHVTVLDSLAGDNGVAPMRINNQGRIVGYSYFADDSDYSRYRSTVVLWEPGAGPHSLPNLTTDDHLSRAYGLNESGQVAGQVTNAAVFWPSADSAPQILLTTGLGMAVNDLGAVVGDSETPTSVHAFRWTAGEGVLDLGGLPEHPYSSGWDINNQRDIVGRSWSLETGDTQPFL